jgi:hypothetical protein
MIRTALFAVAIAVPVIAAAQDMDQTGSINRTGSMVSEQQARESLLRAGYSAIGTLERDSDGIWRTTAMKGDNMMSVAVNRDGNIEDR